MSNRMLSKDRSGRIMNLPSFFTHGTLKNCHIELSEQGNYLWVTLNIEPKMVKYMSPNNVYKSEVHFIYALKQRIENLNYVTVRNVHNDLLSKVMIQCREAKMKVLGGEIQYLNNNLINK